MRYNNFTFDIDIRYRDLDINNHVNNAVYFTYMEEARTKLMLNDFLEFYENGIGFVVTDAQCHYKKPINLTSKVSVKISVENIKGISFDIKYLFFDDDNVMYAVGTTKLACINIKTQKLIRIPQKMLDLLYQMM